MMRVMMRKMRIRKVEMEKTKRQRIRCNRKTLVKALRLMARINHLQITMKMMTFFDPFLYKANILIFVILFDEQYVKPKFV